MTYYKPKERQFLEEYAKNLNFKINKLEQENKKLKQQLEYYKTSNSYKDVVIKLCLNEERSNRWYDIKCLKEKIEHQKVALKSMQKKNKSMKETIKDHQLYEEKLEHRIIEFEELLHWE